MIDKATRDRWVAALRSGEYRQGQGRLIQGHPVLPRDANQNPHTYCCLGVLGCLLSAGQAGDGLILTALYRDNEANFLDRQLLPMAIQEKLADMNDSGYSFRHIADEIELLTLWEEEAQES